MKLGIMAVVVATFMVAVLDYCLYSPPAQERVQVLRWQSAAASGKDANVHAMVRNCRSYTRRTGKWWWKRTRVDYNGCFEDPAAEGKAQVIGERSLAGSTPALAIYFALACVSCTQARQLRSVTIPLDASGTSTLKLPLNLRLDPEEELQLWYTPGGDIETADSIKLPEVE